MYPAKNRYTLHSEYLGIDGKKYNQFEECLSPRKAEAINDARRWAENTKKKETGIKFEVYDNTLHKLIFEISI